MQMRFRVVSDYSSFKPSLFHSPAGVRINEGRVSLNFFIFR